MSVPPEIGSVVGQLVVCLDLVDDPRGRRGRQHRLVDVLTIAVLGCLCGCDDAEALEDWGRKEESWLRGFLDLPWGIPAQDTYLRVLAAIDSDVFQVAFFDWVSSVFPQSQRPEQIAIDGKTARRSGDRAAGQSAVHMVSALACKEGLVLAQQPTGEKTAELTAVRTLLEILELRGSLVSIDAIGCQTDVASRIVEGGGDYLLAVKDNQPTLRGGVEGIFAAARTLRRDDNPDRTQPPSFDECTVTDGDHGRLEIRTARTITDFQAWIPDHAKWRGLQTLVEIASERQDAISGKTSCERRYYISSRRLDASAANVAVRKHWAIENGLHYVLDVTFGEDAYRARKDNAAQNFIVTRHFALSMLRAYNGDAYSIPRRRRLCDYKIDYRNKLLGWAP